MPSWWCFLKQHKRKGHKSSLYSFTLQLQDAAGTRHVSFPTRKHHQTMWWIAYKTNLSILPSLKRKYYDYNNISSTTYHISHSFQYKTISVQQQITQLQKSNSYNQMPLQVLFKETYRLCLNFCNEELLFSPLLVFIFTVFSVVLLIRCRLIQVTCREYYFQLLSHLPVEG